MLNGLLDLSLWGVVAAALVMTHITIASVTIFLHRHQAHRALELNPVVSHFFRFWLWLTTGMVTREWVAIHRKHHAKCETEEDPHSPQVKGLSEVLWRGTELYQGEAANAETLERYGKNTPDDWLERHLYRHNYLGIGIMAAIDLLLFGPIGLTVWAVQMIWIPFWAAGVINGVGHYFGYRNYETSDAATNISPWGILVGGEELHNNHHTFPQSAKLSSRRWEFDIGWFYIRTLEILKLARVRKVAPQLTIDRSKQAVDRETLTTLAANRFAVMSRYYRYVIRPTVARELKQANIGSRRMARQLKRLLRREDTSWEEVARTSGESQSREVLHQIYEYRQRLQALWRRKLDSEGVQALQQWCRDAENTGIDALARFANSLRGFTQATT